MITINESHFHKYPSETKKVSILLKCMVRIIRKYMGKSYIITLQETLNQPQQRLKNQGFQKNDI